ncbi:uncharacterized protein LOC119688493 [Teleopsis dalmanni]|uniref:uncharacterized protein LOC119688493 n=1 Tax=Teleopsis dalmanni TaxID=139649 RepID=UPI0018CEC165|nr:uncharacterized protein LOC119688493 [Teleopsis dalmanni]
MPKLAGKKELKRVRYKRRTSTNQYMMYINLMEKDQIFATQRVPRELDKSYLTNKWKELALELNQCQNGPTLTAEEWRKRLSNWRNATRYKYRRSVSGEKNIFLTAIELQALNLFDKTLLIPTMPEQMSSQLKCAKDAEDETKRTAEMFTLEELQAAFDELIGSDNDDQYDDNEEILPDESETKVEQSNTDNGLLTPYRTTVVENTPHTNENPNEENQLEFITHRKQIIESTINSAVPEIAHTAPATTEIILINGDVQFQRLLSHAPEQIKYEVKEAPINQHDTQGISTIHSHQTHTQEQIEHIQEGAPIADTITITSQDAGELILQVKRIANIKYEKLKFEIEKFKFKNPEFQYNIPEL